MPAASPVIVLIGNTAWSMFNLRGALIAALIEQGYKVVALAAEPEAVYVKKLQDMGVEFAPFHLRRGSLNLFSDLRACYEIWRLMRRYQPDKMLAYGLKAAIWGGLAARRAGVGERFFLLEGLGTAFAPEQKLAIRLARRAAVFLLRHSFKGAQKIIFLNETDRAELLASQLFPPARGVIIDGIGLDENHWSFEPCTARGRFVMAARLVAQKGAREYAAAAAALKKEFPEAVFQLAGFIDSNPAAIAPAELAAWQQSGALDYLGRVRDIHPVYREALAVVLPSYYREGLPATLLEAMATGRAIITTNSVGCRETIVLTEKGEDELARGEKVCEGENGFLIQPRSVKALAEALRRYLKNPALAVAHGKRGREIFTHRFSAKIICQKFCALLADTPAP